MKSRQITREEEGKMGILEWLVEKCPLKEVLRIKMN